MLSCKDITEKANEYIDDELPFMKRLSVQMHLFICKNCRRYMDQLHITIQTLGRLNKTEPVSEERSRQLVECFKKERQS
jgi:predicted anti-sigma-YlaC factor YlaD